VKYMTITVKWLEAKAACPSQVKRFKRMFPRGARLTLDNLQRAAKANLDIDWFVRAYFGLESAQDNQYRQETDFLFLSQSRSPNASRVLAVAAFKQFYLVGEAK
jgi:hypothetical protein